MSNCVHDNGEYCEVLSDKEVRQPCLETPLCEDYKGIVRCKDCIYWCECKTKDKFPFKKDSCNKFGTKMTADDFCSRGERK